MLRVKSLIHDICNFFGNTLRVSCQTSCPRFCRPTKTFKRKVLSEISSEECHFKNMFMENLFQPPIITTYNRHYFVDMLVLYNYWPSTHFWGCMLRVWPDFYDICHGSFTPTPTETKVFCQFCQPWLGGQSQYFAICPGEAGLEEENFLRFNLKGTFMIYLLGSFRGSSSESLELGIIWIFSLLIQLGFRSHGKVWKQWISPLKGVILRPKRFRLLAETSRRKEIWKKKLFLEEI